MISDVRSVDPSLTIMSSKSLNDWSNMESTHRWIYFSVLYAGITMLIFIAPPTVSRSGNLIDLFEYFFSPIQIPQHDRQNDPF